MHLLRIDSSVRIQDSKTRKLTDFFLKQLQISNELSIKIRDVGLAPPKFPTDEFIKANYTSEKNRTKEMKGILSHSDTLIEELFEADKIVIGSPMYNFSISATLKAYIDCIVRVGETFSLDENGVMKGLLEGRKALIITSRGAMSYKNGESLASFDFQEQYLKTLLNFIGITDTMFVHTEAQDFGTDETKKNNYNLSKQVLAELATTW